MGKGRSLMDLRGKVNLSAPMIASYWKGMLVVRNCPRKNTEVKSERLDKIRKLVSELSARWSTALDKYTRDGWEAIAKSCAYRHMRKLVSKGAKNIIPDHKRGLMTGANCYVKSNTLADSCGLSIPRDKAPWGNSLPPSPLIKNAFFDQDEGAIKFGIEEPILPSYYSEKRLRLWASLKYKSTDVARLSLVVSLPIEDNSRGSLKLTTIYVSKCYFGRDSIPISDLPGGIIKLQADIVCAENPEMGALVSAPSNLAEVYLPKKEVLTEEEAKIEECVRQYNRAAKQRQKQITSGDKTLSAIEKLNNDSKESNVKLISLMEKILEAIKEGETK